MAANKVQDGNIIDYTNATGSDIAAGDLVVIGTRVGVALVDIADGAAGAVAVTGVYEVPKEAALAVTQGDLLYADVTSGELDKTALDQTLAGYAFADAAGAASTVHVKLNA
jgi:predicted RecA/RadA family phage recombinase